MCASDQGNVKIMELLLDKGANVNMTTKVLMSRVEQGVNVVSIDILLQSHEWSPLMITSRKGHLKAVKLLLERGAEIDHQNIVRVVL